MHATRCTDLRTLCLNYTRLTNADTELLAGLGTACTRLQTLELRGNRFSSTGCRAVLEAVALLPCLHSLDLSFNRMFPRTTAAPAVLVRGSFSTLKRLRLSALRLGSWGTWWLRSILVHMHALRELHIDRNEIDGTSMAMLYAGMRSCTRLEILKLSYNYLGHAFPVGFGELVPSYRHLACLSLDRNFLTDRGVCALVHCVGSCASLRRLGLSYNALGNPAVMALVCGADAVCAEGDEVVVRQDIFPGLVQLDLAGNLIMDFGAVMLAAWIEAREGVQRLFMVDNVVEAEGEEALAHAKALRCQRHCAVEIL